MNTKIKVLLAFTTIFIVGFASGYLFNDILGTSDDEYMEQHVEREEARGRMLRFRNTNQPKQIERMQHRIWDRLVGRLDLTAEQQEPFFERMSEYRSTLRNSVREIRSREGKRIREHYHTFRTDVSKILTEDQLDKLDTQLHPDSVRQIRLRRVRPDEN